MKTINNTKSFVLIECVLIMVVLQALRIGGEKLLALGFPALPGKMQTMCAMIVLWLLCAAFIRARRVEIRVFPKPFTRNYWIFTVLAAALLILTPSNFSGGYLAILELFYGSIVTPVFEETVFRGYMWERLNGVLKSEKAVYLVTTLLFTVWHLGYMLTQLLAGNFFAVVTKLVAALVYGLILGYLRKKGGNLFLPILAHGVMNIFMI